jgi:hypothetical protein
MRDADREEESLLFSAQRLNAPIADIDSVIYRCVCMLGHSWGEFGRPGSAGRCEGNRQWPKAGSWALLFIRHFDLRRLNGFNRRFAPVCEPSTCSKTQLMTMMKLKMKTTACGFVGLNTIA